METKIIKLKNGITIKDMRTLGCGVQIENQNTKYVKLSYSKRSGLYLNIISIWLTKDECAEYFKELKEMIFCLSQAHRRL